MRNHMKMASILVAVIGLSSIALPVLAHADGACMDDVKKLCGDIKPGGGSIGDCLKAHSADLSQGCKDNMAEGKKKMEDMKKALEQACQADLKQYCANVTPGQGREFMCLRAYDDKISAGCKEALPKPRMPMGMMHHGDHDGGDHMGSSPSTPPSK